MNISESSMPGVYEIRTPPAYVDQRGTLSRVFDARNFQEQGIDVVLQQHTYQLTRPKNVLRGMYIQTAPFTEAKLITILSGEVYWVALDVRKGSPNFGKWHALTLTPEDITGVYIDGGFAHGCLSLSENCGLIISADNYYSEGHGFGIAWDDPELGIEWPVGEGEIIISDAHKAYPSFEDFKKNCGGI